MRWTFRRSFRRANLRQISPGVPMRDKAFSWLLLFLFGLCMEPALAGEDDAFSLRGFGTLGLARSSSDHAEYVRDLSQPLGIKGGQ